MSRHSQTTFSKEKLKDDLLVDRLTVPNAVIIGAASEESGSIVEVGKEYEKLQLYDKALAWYRIAADKNSFLALNHIGKLYEEGLGVAQNYYTAFEWYLKAAKLSKYAGRVSIGDMFSKGRGVSVNYYKAIEWFLKARNADDKIREIASHCDNIDAIEDKKALSLLINETDDIIRKAKEKNLKQIQDQYESLIVEKIKMEDESNSKIQKIESLKHLLLKLQSSPKHAQAESKFLLSEREENHKKDKEILTKELRNTEQRISGLQQGLNNKEQALFVFENKVDSLRQSISRNKALKESNVKLQRELKERINKEESLKQKIQTLQDESKHTIGHDDTIDLLKNLLQSRENEIELIKENTRLLLFQETQRATCLEKENRELKIEMQECENNSADISNNVHTNATPIKIEIMDQDDLNVTSKKRKLSDNEL